MYICRTVFQGKPRHRLNEETVDGSKVQSSSVLLYVRHRMEGGEELDAGWTRKVVQ
jgi:hypothetical protein